MSELEERYQRFAELNEKRTNGAWKIIKDRYDYNNSHWIGIDDYTSIAEVRNGADDEEYGGKETELSNAKFIASSPEIFDLLTEYRAENAKLREALRECVRFIDESTQSRDFIDYWDDARHILRQTERLGITPKGEL